MEWGLFVVAVALVALLQIAVWRRLQSDDVDTADATESAVQSDRLLPPETPPQREQDDPGVTTCPSCGADNETGYRFCRECAETLYL
ncbi:DUF7577 domain-containing protein [Halobacterium zhouii]|uniref:DUF7577 domain-containing protein n=1 Tax=Halobacterium zhouii TaxID=2902624 RepID=UPI001E52CFB6|nr:zinc ribbon domain-containing protein [Halobacterium zhouii]